MTNAPRGNVQNKLLPTQDAQIEQALIKIIQQGDVKALIETAELLGKQLVSENLATAQIRNIFGTARRIQAMHQELKKADSPLWRDFVLLKPKLAYQARRKKEVKLLVDWLTVAIDLVDRDHTRFVYFMEFFEAVLAYHTANGGSDKEEGRIRS